MVLMAVNTIQTRTRSNSAKGSAGEFDSVYQMRVTTRRLRPRYRRWMR